MKFLKGFLVFILIAIIVGGVGYIGYTFIFMGGMDHSANGGTSAQTQQPADSNTAQNQQGMQPGTMNSQSQQNTNQQANNNQIGINQSNIILQNKEKLDKAIASFNESLRLMSVDPYAPGTNNTGSMSGMENMQMPQQQDNVTVQPAQDNTAVVTTPGNNTTINIYPQSGSTMQPGSMTQYNSMQNMGTTYDASKMEKLHTGLYKISVGKALLDQLRDELAYQAEYATGNTQYPVQYYTNQYSLTVQNKTKLNEALTYINEAANLVNINPYVSAAGLVYDKDRMGQIHESILKLAEGVVSLNQLNDSLTKQSIYLANTVQNYVNAGYTDSQQMNHATMSTGLFGGLFNNISISSVVNIILILFVIGLIFGIFGFIYSLLKPSVKKYTRKEEQQL